MSLFRRLGPFCLSLEMIALAVAVPAVAVLAQDRAEDLDKKLETIGNSLVLDGSRVHTAGNLQMNVTNFGFLGSLPSSRYPMADSPSAQWPAGSGVEYLYAAGIWVGAELDGVPVVSTGYPETELYPPNDAIDIIYGATEGARGGRTYPADPDDDRDGLIDEDWLNGRDDDGDGRVDEDFAAIGKLMYSCWFTDDEAIAREVWPEHLPLSIKVKQETFQWSEEGVNDFVGVRYTITNVGMKLLNNAYVGIYADLDAGPRDRPSYYKDDQIGSWSGIWCAKTGGVELPVRFGALYVYDGDGDDGATEGYFGIAFLSDEPHAIRIFAGLLPFARGGEPINDFQRYAALSESIVQPNTEAPNDYRALASMGPVWLSPGYPERIDIAFVAGKGLAEFLDNAAMAKLVYNGTWIDGDKRPSTGKSGRETPVVGPIDLFDPDPCDNKVESLKIAKFDTIWGNMDCSEEKTLWNFPDCYKGTLTFQKFQTGIDGKEKHINWVVSTVSPPPRMRAIPGEALVTLIWDNLSEISPDQITGIVDFEGYQIWRADDWHRPIGTTVATGPSNELWHMIDSRDLVNNVPPDIDFKKPIREGGCEYEPLMRFENRDVFIKAFEENVYYDPLGEVPCPPGLTNEECDTLEALARWNLGYEGGRRYYCYVDREVKNGLPYFYSVIAYDHGFQAAGVPKGIRAVDSPYSNFAFAVPRTDAQTGEEFREEEVYVVPNPVTRESMAPWTFGPSNADPSGEKVEFRNLPRCLNTVRIYTVAGDLVQTLRHDGSGGNGTLRWNLITRNGQDVTSGIYLFSVVPDDDRFSRCVGKFVVIR